MMTVSGRSMRSSSDPAGIGTAMFASGTVPALLPAHIGVSQTSQFIAQSGLCRHPGVGAVAVDGFAVGAGDVAGAVGVDGEGPAEVVQDDVVVPPAVVLEVGQAGGAAVFAVGDVVGFALGGGLVAAAGVLAVLVSEGDQASQVDGDVVGLADVEREGRAGEGFAEQVAAQEAGGAAGPGDDLQDRAEDLLLQVGQGAGDGGSELGPAGGGAGQAGRDGATGGQDAAAGGRDVGVVLGGGAV